MGTLAPWAHWPCVWEWVGSEAHAPRNLHTPRLVLAPVTTPNEAYEQIPVVDRGIRIQLARTGQPTLEIADGRGSDSALCDCPGTLRDS